MTLIKGLDVKDIWQVFEVVVDVSHFRCKWTRPQMVDDMGPDDISLLRF